MGQFCNIGKWLNRGRMDQTCKF